MGDKVGPNKAKKCRTTNITNPGGRETVVWTSNVATEIPKIPECPGVATIGTPKP